MRKSQIHAQIINLQILGSQISKSATFAEFAQSNKLFRSATLLICNLRNLFADRPSLTLNVGWIEKEAANMYICTGMCAQGVTK